MSLIWDGLFLCGLALLVYGVSLLSWPAALILAGLTLAGLALVGASR